MIFLHWSSAKIPMNYDSDDSEESSANRAKKEKDSDTDREEKLCLWPLINVCIVNT